MNIGLLVGPLLAGAIYEHVGYDAVFAILLLVNGLAFGLRAAAIDTKGVAAVRQLQHAGMKDSAFDSESGLVGSGGQTNSAISPSSNSVVATKKNVESNQQTTAAEAPTEHSRLLPYRSTETEGSTSWLASTFPTVTVLWSSKRLNAAIYGGFLHTLIITAFDTILPIFVIKTFHWKATASGLIFLAITVPSLLGTFVGMLSDRYGPRLTCLSGLGLATPALGLFALSRDDSITSLVLMIVSLIFIGKWVFLQVTFLEFSIFQIEFLI